MDARTHEEGACDDCGSDYPMPWFAPNDLWNRVIPNRTGMLCPNCFLFRAQSAGINPTGWEIREEGTQWIKITDDPQTLPKLTEMDCFKREMLRVYFIVGDVIREGSASIGFADRMIFWVTGDRGYEATDVRYWMPRPLPAPPPES